MICKNLCVILTKVRILAEISENLGGQTLAKIRKNLGGQIFDEISKNLPKAWFNLDVEFHVP